MMRPRIRRSDGILGLALDGYDFGRRRLDARETDVWRTRLGPVPVIWMRGAAAAELFYDADRFERSGVLPRRVRRTLTGEGAVQELDGDAHRDRKSMLMRVMTPDSITELESRAIVAWQLAIETWSTSRDAVMLTEAVAALHSRAAHQWLGIPAGEHADAGDLQALYDGPAALGARHWRARAARRRLDQWGAALVEGVRAGRVPSPEGSPLGAIAAHRDLSGHELSSHVAGVELLNLLRPIVAVERYVCFAVVALHAHPEWAARLRRIGPDRDADAEHFCHEVRRTSPFFPAVAARVRNTFEWHGVTFPAGRLAILDLYATNRDPAAWNRPDEFDPDRFSGRRIDPYELVPQGGGDHTVHHRCAGEWITMRLLRVGLDTLTQRTDYTLPPQDLTVDLRRVPARPRSGVVIRDVREHRVRARPRRGGPSRQR